MIITSVKTATVLASPAMVPQAQTAYHVILASLPRLSFTLPIKIVLHHALQIPMKIVIFVETVTVLALPVMER